MNGRLIIPPEIVDVDGPMVFLAGPIQGALWQPDAISLLKALSPQLHIASPRRDYIDLEFDFNRQVDWETHYLSRAARQGAVMFWLAKEEHHQCDRCFAQTTRFELAEWKLRHEYDGVKLIVGIEEGFSGSKYIRRRFSQDCAEIKICSSLAETCQQVVDQIFA